MQAGLMPARVLLLALSICGLAASRETETPAKNGDPQSELDCGVRRLALDYARKSHPTHLRDTWAALELGARCGDDPPGDASEPAAPSSRKQAAAASNGLYVAPGGDDLHGDGSFAAPFGTVHRALEAIKLQRASGLGRSHSSVILRGGIHFLGLNGTLRLTAEHNGISISSHMGEAAWLSGGIPATGTAWERVSHPSTGNATIWKMTVKGLPQGAKVRNLYTVESHERFIWARYPNMDVEKEQWGRGTTDWTLHSIQADMVEEWTRPPEGNFPQFTYVDLRDPSNPSGVVKNNSQMALYNTFSIGSGGACGTVWSSPSYWCSNASDGGRGSVDRDAAIAGQMGIPIGLRWNETFGRPSTWADPRGAFIHAWQSETWAVHMFEVGTFDRETRLINFTAGGGSQGSRHWCRCDQCSGATSLWGPDRWCGSKPGPDGTDRRLIGGAWIVEGVFEELDHPGEFWYNTSSGELWVWPNSSDSRPPPALVIPVLDRMASVEGANGISFNGVGFRDAVSTYDRQWGVPSGGDWGLYPDAALYLRDTDNVEVRDCIFRRLDGNGIFLHARNRDALISGCSFEWIGQTAAAAWGETEDWDGRSGTQPRGTIVEDGYFHDVGLYEKQSAAWFQARSAQTTLRGNLMFNVPRAAINFNDGFGGGNVLTGNLIFNSCRESEDHGPINTWDRMPFFTDVAEGPGSPSWNPRLNEVHGNFIWANDGAAQGVDNDDGSSFWWIHDNVFQYANGFKMDFGGHNSRFDHNMVLSKWGGSSCIGVGEFLPGIGDVFVNNTCLQIGSDHGGGVGHVSQCDTPYIDMRNNRYMTGDGKASMSCGGKRVTIQELAKSPVAAGSVVEKLPPTAAILDQVRQRLGLEEESSRLARPSLYI